MYLYMEGFVSRTFMCVWCLYLCFKSFYTRSMEVTTNTMIFMPKLTVFRKHFKKQLHRQIRKIKFEP